MRYDISNHLSLRCQSVVMAQNVSKSCSLRYQKTCKNRCCRCFSPSLAHTSAARKCSIPTSFGRNFVAKWPVWLPIRAATRVSCRILWKPFAETAQQNGRDCHATSPILLIEMVHIPSQPRPFSLVHCSGFHVLYSLARFGLYSWSI